MNSLRIFVLSTATAMGLAACNKPLPASAVAPAPTQQAVQPPPAGVRIAAIDLGNTIGTDNRVTAPNRTFALKDTIYAAVSTTGTAASATITAKWTYQDGQTVNEESQTIAPTGPAVTSFHISNPDGWPVGNYTVIIMVDGKSAGTASFEAK